MKTFAEMSNRELFSVLTGNEGPMAQMQLQKIIKSYLAYCKHHGDAHPDVDLQTMIKEYLDGKYEE